MNDIVRTKGFAQGPRWASFPTFLKNECFLLDLKCKIEVEKGFLKETVRWTVEGPEDKVDQLKDNVTAAIEQWNNK